MRKQEEMRVNHRKLKVILANGRKMSKYAEIQALKVIYRYVMIFVVTKL